MPFIPSSSSILYKKYANIHLPQSIIFSNQGNNLLSDWNNIHNIEILDAPNYLQIVNLYYDSNEDVIKFIINVDETVAVALSPDVYTSSIRIRFVFSNWLFPDGVTYTSEINPLQVVLTVQDTIMLEVNPQQLSFNYNIGESIPQNNLLTIQAEENWTITSQQNWVTLSSTFGNGNANVVVGVDPSSLPVGVYTSQLIIQDSFFTKNVIITLTVTEGDTDNNYLYLNPRNFFFVSEYEVSNNTQLPLTLDASHTWTATPSDSWIQISGSTGDSGVSDLLISVDSDSLSIGDYNGTIQFEANGIVKIVYLTLRVLEFLVDGVANDTLYFAEDRNKLLVNSIQENTFLTLDIVASHETDNTHYEQEAPYFQGQASIVVGEETKHFLKSVTPTNVFNSRIQNNIQPITLTMQVWNVNKFIEQITPLTNFNQLKFLNGKTPQVTNKLCYIPSKIHVTKDAVISLSVLSTENPQTIEVSGDVNTTINSVLGNNLFVYNAIVNLRDLGVTPGQTITVNYAGFNTTIYILEPVTERRLLAFENEWNEYEFFETRGVIIEKPTAKKTTTQLQIESTKHTRIVSIDSGCTYSLNTGWIHSQEEVDWLLSILKSKRIFIYEDNTPIEIELTTKTLQKYKTRDHLKSFNLKFKKAILND